MKIKILHITQSSFGVRKYLFMLFSNMNRLDFQQILICSQEHDIDIYSGIIDEAKQMEMNREISLNDISAVRKIRRLIKSYNPDIIYCHSSKGGALGRLASLGIKNTKIIYNPHGWAFNMDCSKLKRKLYVFIERFLSKFTERIIVISEAEKKSSLHRKICKEEKLTVIYNGIDINKIQQTSAIDRISLGIPQDAFVIGTVGRISKQKSPDIFIKAAQLIKKQIPEAYFIIVGDGELRIEIEKLATEYQIFDSLTITGWIEDVNPYIRLFDVALLLSRWEGFGLVLAEYMAIGKPIVATEIDAIPELITNNENGLLVPVEDPVEVCNAVLKIKSNFQLKDHFIQEGLRIVKEKFDIKRVAIEHEKLFQQLIN
ncbi:glycosyl transferase family 1 [Bacteroidia bacterium]|nr:glycosyl transferase family 1 [Bacteroidia bacterium]GHT26945.1 glycosyl transferase family 1 [Bacteroidia bacterium]